MSEVSHLRKKILEKSEQHAGSIDGFARPEDMEERINDVMRICFADDAGEQALDYLRSITMNVVLPATASDAELRMQEGMRRLFGIIYRRAVSQPKG